MKKLKSPILGFLVFATALLFFTSCGKEDDNPNKETCFDGIQNQTETGIDCGGVCMACPTCDDGIQNGTETGIDCGGSCDSCIVFKEFMTAVINGASFEANFVVGGEVGAEIEFQSDQSQDQQMFFTVFKSLTPGSYDLVNTNGYSVRFVDSSIGEYMTQSGTIVISSHEKVLKELSGTFEFTAVFFDSGNPVDTVVVTEGVFGVAY